VIKLFFDYTRIEAEHVCAIIKRVDSSLTEEAGRNASRRKMNLYVNLYSKNERNLLSCMIFSQSFSENHSEMFIDSNHSRKTTELNSGRRRV
jgi:hypothetical protein